MKSFVGILRGDGASPDERLLRHLASKLRLPSSSEPHLAIDGPCGLAIVSHRGDFKSPHFNAAMIAGNVRLDDRRTLLRELDAPAATDDDELVLLAWRRWGRDCAAHLFGDFSFSIWDRATQELFGARDRFGVRPFYFARIEQAMLFSDLLDAILAHPDVNADDLDARAVADYLDGGVPNDADATIYTNVRRLPPAHALSRGVAHRYWTLQAPHEQSARNDAPARLEAALQDAIADRVSGPSAVVFMSGGLDSTALAAIAHELNPQTQLLAGTSIYRTRIADVEESFAAEAARAINIPIDFYVLDEHSPLESLERGIWTAEPGPLLTAAMTREIYARAAAHAPVALHGHPADAVLAADLGATLRTLLRNGRAFALTAAFIDSVRVRRRPPWFFFRELARWPGKRVERSEPMSIRVLQSSMWSSYFEWAHPLLTRAPIELAYPFCDLRVIDAALAMPPFPWLIEKHVLREVLRGRISEVIRKRPKTFAQGNPWIVPVSEPPAIDAASRYVDPVRFAEMVRSSGTLRDETLRAVALEWWLQQRPRAIHDLRTMA